MAQASHKKFGAGQQDRGKGDGSGGMAPAEVDTPLPGEVLSNRDTSRHSEQRGLDSRHVQGEQLREHVGSRIPRGKRPLADDAPDDTRGPGRVEDEP